MELMRTTQVVDIATEVMVRKYPVDQEKLVSVLRNHRGGILIKDIADRLAKPETMVAHWFRTDKYFAIPDADIWYELKSILKIDTDEFDAAITTFEYKEGVYDMQNRVYIGDISPTLTSGCGKYFYLLPGEKK